MVGQGFLPYSPLFRGVLALRRPVQNLKSSQICLQIVEFIYDWWRSVHVDHNPVHDINVTAINQLRSQ